MLFQSDWRAGMQDVSAAIDDHMGETIIITPYAVIPKPNYPAEVDASRAVTVVGVFTSPASVALGAGKSFSGNTEVAPLVSTRVPQFSFGVANLPFPVKPFFRLTRCLSGETFEVTDVQADGVARVVVKVIQLGREAAKWKGNNT